VPYSTSVTYLETVGEQPIPKTARLWMVWSVVGGPPGTGNMQSEEETFEFDLQSGQAPVAINFNKDADYTYASRSVGLSIQDTNRVAQDRGWLFRSGRFETLPTDPIEIINANVDITASDVPGMLPATPITVDAQTSITSLTATLAASTAGAPGGIDFVATGTTSKTGVVVGFTYSGRMVLDASTDIAAAESEALSVGIANPSITFLPGPSVLSAIEAELLNLFRVVIMREVGPQIRDNLERRINASVISSAGRQLPGGVLPAGVVLSVRTVTIGTPPGASEPAISVRAAVGAFGGVFSKLPQPSSGGGGKVCAGQTLVALGLAAGTMSQFRALRDGTLGLTAEGRRLIAEYYRFSPEVSELLRADPSLARRAIGVAGELALALRDGFAVPPSILLRGEALLREFARRGSFELAAAVEDALRLAAWQPVPAKAPRHGS